jgi:excisionase family DNA binding protein
VREDTNRLSLDVSASQSLADGKLLTVSEACGVLRVSKWTVYRLIQSNQLATIKIGRRRLVPMAAVTNLLNRLRTEGAV